MMAVLVVWHVQWAEEARYVYRCDIGMFFLQIKIIAVH